MRIFNQLRKLEIERQKVKSYLIYALGEIVLIVAGILIALQINNWNQGINEHKQRTEALGILQQTIQNNDAEIDQALVDLDRLMMITDARIGNSGPEVTTVSDSVIQAVKEIDFVSLNLINNGEPSVQYLSLLSGEVRSLLLEFATAHKAYQQLEGNVTSLSLKLRENHQQYVSLLTQGAYEEGFTIADHSVFPSDYAGWLSDRNNQNLSVEIKWKARASRKALQKLHEINGAILQTTRLKLYGTTRVTP